jgi:hypothetical protein
MGAYSFTIFSGLFVKENHIKVTVASMKSLPYCEIPSRNPLWRLFGALGFLPAAFVSKSYSVTRL